MTQTSPEVELVQAQAQPELDESDCFFEAWSNGLAMRIVNSGSSQGMGVYLESSVGEALEKASDKTITPAAYGQPADPGGYLEEYQHFGDWLRPGRGSRAFWLNRNMVAKAPRRGR